MRRGRAISAPQAKKLLQSSYKQVPDVKIGDWELDESISRPTARVYYNPVIQQGAVVHRGTDKTLGDWSNNLQYVMGTNKLTNRYKEAEIAQKKAEEKYPNVLTLGHSQGGIYTKIARDQSKVINVNPASMGETTSGTTIRSKNDPVSMIAGLTGLFKKNPKNITTSAQLNPLKAHSLDILDELGDKMLGEGLRKMYRPKRKGKGVMDFLKNPKKAINDARYAVIGATEPLKKTVEGVIYGPQDHAPYVRKIIEQYGDKKIVRAVAHRKPVDKPLIGALNVVSMGQFNKQNPYDELFHLSLFLFLEDGTVMSIEKIENINILINPPTHAKAETQEIGNFHPVTLNELIDGAKKVLGDKYFKYDAAVNNCQAYIMALLKGSGLGTAEDYKFIKQDTEQIFKGLGKTLALSNALTDIGARASVAMYGGKLKKIKGVVKRI